MPHYCKSAVTDHAAMAAHLLHLVSELRGLRDRAVRDTGRHVTFAEVAHASVVDQPTVSNDSQLFLADLAEILDSNPPQTVDEELATHWRSSLRAWLAPNR